MLAELFLQVHLPLWPLQMAAAELLKRTAGLENSALRSVPLLMLSSITETLDALVVAMQLEEQASKQMNKQRPQ